MPLERWRKPFSPANITLSIDQYLRTTQFHTVLINWLNIWACLVLSQSPGVYSDWQQPSRWKNDFPHSWYLRSFNLRCQGLNLLLLYADFVCCCWISTLPQGMISLAPVTVFHPPPFRIWQCLWENFIYVSKARAACTIGKHNERNKPASRQPSQNTFSSACSELVRIFF